MFIYNKLRKKVKSCFYKDSGLSDSTICKLPEWSIAGRMYSIELADKKYDLMNEEVQILINSGDKIMESGINGNAEQKFMGAVLTHQENYLIGSYKIVC